MNTVMLTEHQKRPITGEKVDIKNVPRLMSSIITIIINYAAGWSGDKALAMYYGCAGFDPQSVYRIS
jgi:hypothetical protein